MSGRPLNNTSALHCGSRRCFGGSSCRPIWDPKPHKGTREQGGRPEVEEEEEGGASFFFSVFQKRLPRRFHRRRPPPSVGFWFWTPALGALAAAGMEDGPELPRWRRDNRDSRKWASTSGPQRKRRGVGRLRVAGTSTRLPPYVQLGLVRSASVQAHQHPARTSLKVMLANQEARSRGVRGTI